MVLFAPGLYPGRDDIRERLVHGPDIVPRVLRDDWPLFGNPRAGHAYDCGKQVISASRGRSVVLTIGRLVASNPSFASFHAPAYLRPAGSNISMVL